MNAWGGAALSEGITGSARREQIPALLQLALMSWAFCATAYSLMRLSFFPELLPVYLSCALVFAILSLTAALSYTRKASPAKLCLLALLLGLSLSLAGCALYAQGLREAAEAPVSRITLLEDARQGQFGPSALVSVEGDRVSTHIVQAYLPQAYETSVRGEVFSCMGTVSVLDEQPDDYSWSRKVTGSVRLSALGKIEEASFIAPIVSLRKRAIEGLEKVGGNQAGLMQALACGYKRLIEANGEYDACKLSGLAHLVAVSGAHLAIVCAFVNLLLNRLGLGLRLRAVFCTLFIAAYLVFSGLAVSAIRSAMMSLAAMFSFTAKRRASSLSALGVCILVFLAFDPSSSLSASLILSAGSTLGIILFAGLFSSWFEGVRPPLQAVAETASLTLAANLVTQPYSVSLFSQLPLLALPANVLAAPLFAPSCVLSLLAACAAALSPEYMQALISIAAVCCLPLQGLILMLSNIPYSNIAFLLPAPWALLLSFICAYLLWRFWPSLKPHKALIFLASILIPLVLTVGLTGAYDRSRDEIIALDVGQGDSFLIRSQGVSLLVDTGTNDAKLRASLARHRIRHIDAVLITHGDDDHCGSLEALTQVCKVDSVILSSPTKECPCDPCDDLRTRCQNLRGTPQIIYLERGDDISCGHFTWEVLWPAEFSEEGGNADSLCLLGSYTKGVSGQGQKHRPWSVLLTGDLEADALKAIAASHEIGDIDVLKLGHHGSRASLDDDLTSSLDPEITLIGVGANNRYGHPSKEVLEMLDGISCHVLRTDLHGDIVLDFSEHEIEVRTQREQGSGTIGP